VAISITIATIRNNVSIKEKTGLFILSPLAKENDMAGRQTKVDKSL